MHMACCVFIRPVPRARPYYTVFVETTKTDTVVSVRLPADIIGQLDELAGEMDRTRSYLIAKAVREYVEREYDHLLHVREGEADIEAGRFKTGDEMRKWIEQLKADAAVQGSRKRAR